MIPYMVVGFMPSLSTLAALTLCCSWPMDWLGRGSSSEAVWEEVTLECALSPPWMSWEEQVGAQLSPVALPLSLTMG